MPEKPLEFKVLTFTAKQLEIKVKNIGKTALSVKLSIELYFPKSLVDQKVQDAADQAATNQQPIGVASLAGVVTCPERWSIWARPETSDSSVVVLLLNDLDQAGKELKPPIELAASQEFTIRVPLDPEANRDAVSLVYRYQPGDQEKDQVDGTLELKSGETIEWTPDVTLTTNHESPMMIQPPSQAKIFWHVRDGVSATLFGPLPGGNSKRELSPSPDADFKISDGSIDILVVGAMTYILHAEVKRPGHDNVHVVRMLSLDISGKQYSYLSPRPTKVLPYGLIEIDWAAWGVKEVTIEVSGITSRTIGLTQQTLGRAFEGSGTVRVNATKQVMGVKTLTESIKLLAAPQKPQTESVQVVSWITLMRSGLDDYVSGLAVIAPKMAVLGNQGLYVAHVGRNDEGFSTDVTVEFALKSTSGNYMWQAVTAVEQRFVVLRMDVRTADVEIAPHTVDGDLDEIPPITLPDQIKPVAAGPNAVIDFVGFDKRVYFVAEGPKALGRVRLACSVGFNNETKKADLRPEPMLEALIGYRLLSFDNALYALNRSTGRMFRFDLNKKDGTLLPPKKAASAIKKNGAVEQSMIADGLLVPVGHLLVVMTPTSVPSVASLEQYGRQNTLRYTSTGSGSTPANIPQDLFYNPQKDYWGRCGRDLDIKPGAVAAFRDADARLWLFQDNTLRTLTGSETLFAPDYWSEFEAKPLGPYLNKKRQFKITNNTGMQFRRISETHQNAGLKDFSAAGPAELTSQLPETFPHGATETFEFSYNATDPVPIQLRFEAEHTRGGIKHHYVLEVTFSGADLSSATSVFKRLTTDARGALSVIDIAGTLANHTTNNPIVVPAPKLLVEGVTLRALNATTYQIWREVPAGDSDEASNRYQGDEIRITWDTPPFSFLAYGAGELDVEADFALPLGVEISPGTEPQRKLIRINTSKSTGLHPEMLPNKGDTVFECNLRYLRKQELKAVYIGDGVAQGEAIYLPVALASIQAVKQVLKINAEDLSFTASANFTPVGQAPGVFATPNSVAVTNQYVLAMFGDTDIQILDFSLQVQDKLSVSDAYTLVTDVKYQADDECFLLGMRKDKVATQGINFHYLLGTRYITKNYGGGPKKIVVSKGREISLDAVKGGREQNRVAGSPVWVSAATVSPMAVSTSIVSPGGERVREAAVCIDGGLFVVGSSDRTIRVLAIESAGREEDIVFGDAGKTIYCLHSQGDNQGLRLSRVDNKSWKKTASLELPRGDGIADLTTDTEQRQPGTPRKNQRSTSLVRTGDEKYLFVSHGRSIFKIDAATMSLRETYKMELPCRLFHARWGKPTQHSHITYGSPGSCTVLYAIGASYRGNGYEAKEFKTHIYKLAIPDK